MISDCHGNGRDHSRGCHRCGSGVGFRSFWSGSARRPLRRNPPGAPQVDPKAASLGQPRAGLNVRVGSIDPAIKKPTKNPRRKLTTTAEAA